MKYNKEDIGFALIFLVLLGAIEIGIYSDATSKITTSGIIVGLEQESAHYVGKVYVSPKYYAVVRCNDGHHRFIQVSGEVFDSLAVGQQITGEARK